MGLVCLLGLASASTFAAPSLDIAVKAWPNKVGNYPVSECEVETSLTNNAGADLAVAFDMILTDKDGKEITVNRSVPDSKTVSISHGFGGLGFRNGGKATPKARIYLGHGNLPNCEAIAGWKVVKVSRCLANDADVNPDSCLRLFKPTSGSVGSRNLPDFPSPRPAPAPERKKPDPAPKPLAGWYNCYTMGYQMSLNGRFMLHADGHYENPQGNRGRYRLNGDNIRFETGSFRDWGWEGIYQNDKSTVVIKPAADPTPPGKEGIGKYQYCYHE